MTPRDEQWLEAVIRKAETADECKLAVTVFLNERKTERAASENSDTSTMYESSSLPGVLRLTDYKNRAL